MSTNPEYLPETPEELTATWLGAALNAPISQVEQRALGEGKGFMGDVLRLSLRSEAPEVPASVVAKIPKKANRAVGELMGVYEREIMFFRTLGQDMPIRIPQMLFSEFDRDKGSENQEAILRGFDKMPLFLHGAIGAFGAWVAAAKKRRYLLIIEDLASMRAADQLQGLDEDGCVKVLEAIAPMHRQFWGAEALQGHFWLLPLDVDARLRHVRFRQSREQFGQVMGSGLAETLDWLMDNGERLTRQFVADTPATLAHCDLRMDNVMFDEGDRCAFIDWQLVRRAPAAWDVAYFICGALHSDQDAACVERILHRYHKALSAPDYSFDDLQRDYQRALLLHVANLASAGDGDIDFGNERGSTMMATWMQRLAARATEVGLPNDIG